MVAIWLFFYIIQKSALFTAIIFTEFKEQFSFQNETMGANFHEEKRIKTKFATVEAEYNLKN